VGHQQLRTKVALPSVAAYSHIIHLTSSPTTVVEAARTRLQMFNKTSRSSRTSLHPNLTLWALWEPRESQYQVISQGKVSFMKMISWKMKKTLKIKKKMRRRKRKN